MISVTGLIDILKGHNILVDQQALSELSDVTGKPVTDSRQLQANDIFICIKGYTTDGHKYIKKARQIGASLIVQEDSFIDNMPAIRVTDSRKATALLARLYYNNPTQKFTLIGVTGTNGKTTTSMLIWQALRILGHKAGWIGTLGYRIENEIIKTENTTPDIIELNEILDSMVKAGCKYVVMEVSSHALALDRVLGLSFKIAVFTNLSREHLDFHMDMDNYFSSKLKLFEYTAQNNGISIINSDDEYGKILVNKLSSTGIKNTVTVSESTGDYIVRDFNNNFFGSTFVIQTKEGENLKIQTGLVGKFNMLNTAMSIAVLKTLFSDLSIKEIKRITQTLQPVNGRLEQVSNNRNIGVFIDYAHTPAALKVVLETLQILPHKRIITVFGAGGDRDKGKRPEMLKQALLNSNAVIITDDNPRTENPNSIIREVVGNNDLWEPWWIIRNREKAIQAAIRLANENDIVLIAGKGHESYQEINGIRRHFDDVETAANFLCFNEHINPDELILPIDPLMLELIYDRKFINSSNKDLCFKFVSTDSRNIQPKSLFFALKGDRFDGMDYLNDVLTDERNAAIVSANNSGLNRTIYHKDTAKAYSILAKKYLIMFPVYKIALTGTTGKTTTKEILVNIFSEHGQVLKTAKNENNIIGLSKTIFKISEKDKTAIFELGTNHFGEIGQLADVCNPDLAIILNIGPGHLEFFGDEIGVYKEKTELFRRKVNKLLYPGDDLRFKEFEHLGVSIGFLSGCDYRINKIRSFDHALELTLNNNQWLIPNSYSFFAINYAFAISCAIESGILNDLIAKGVSKPLNLPFRMEVKTMNNRLFIVDCYNANPVSMKSAIDFWHSYHSERPHIAILGDMLELGEKSEEYHKKIGNMLDNIDYDLLITIGDLSRFYSNELSEEISQIHHKHYKTVDDFLKNPLLPLLPENSIVLIKASHSMKLEKIIEKF